MRRTKTPHPFLLSLKKQKNVQYRTIKLSTKTTTKHNIMAKVKIQPLGDRVLVKQVEEKEQVRGGIIIPDAAKEKSQEAEVVAIGSGKLTSDGKRQAFEVKVGDKVLISKYGGTEVSMGDEKYMLMREEDIIAILK